MSSTMRAVVLAGPGPPEALQIREVPMPVPAPGWVLIEVKAFGLNRSELYTRLGHSPGVEFPRVLGIEATCGVPGARRRGARPRADRLPRPNRLRTHHRDSS